MSDEAKPIEVEVVPPAEEDPRLGLTSASSTEMDFVCLGRRQFLRTIDPVELAKASKPSPEATRGTAIHKAREIGNSLALDEEDAEIYNTGVKNVAEIVNQWKEDFGITEYKECPRELRLYLHDDDLNPVASGQLDEHYLSTDPEGYLLVIDWKALYCKNLPGSYRSWQGKTQVVLCSKEYSVTRGARFAFNKPMLKKTDHVDYSIRDIEMSEHSIRYRLWEIEQDGAQRTPGGHCNYCPGKAWCPEAGAMTMLPTVLVQPLTAVKAKARNAQIVGLVEQLPLSTIKRIFLQRTIIGKILESIADRLKGLTDEQLAPLGLQRRKAMKLDPILDTKGCFDFLKEQGISEIDLFGAMEFSKKKVRDTLQVQFQWGEDRAKEWIDTELAPFITKKESERGIEEAD